LTSALEEQAKVLIKSDGMLVEKKMEEYRHTAYTLSTDERVISSLEDDVLSDSELTSIYNMMYTVITDALKHADVHIVSKSGKIRISSGIFPSEYDTRIQGNEWNRKNIIAEATTRRDLGRQSLIFIGDHRINEDGEQILFSILRNVFGADEAILGYVIIDVYTEAVIPELTNGSIFRDVLLVDNSLYQAFSLNHPNSYGSFDRFPFLTNENAKKYYYHFPSGTFSIIGYIDTDIYKGNSQRMFLSALLALLLGSVVSVILSVVFSHSISKRVNTLISNMKYIEEGNLNIYLGETGITEFDQLSTSFNTMVTKIIYLIQSRSEEEAKAAEAERKALESQLNPHFIFNTLNTIKALAKLHGESEIYTISLQLGKLLRSSLKNHSSTCLLSESISLTESYLAIQKIRFSEKLTYKVNTNGVETDRIITPKLMIQPLVENAVVHGLEPQNGSVNIDIDISVSDSRLHVKVSDNGAGMEYLPEFRDPNLLKDTSHVGLYNIYKRLDLRYKDDFTFDIETEPGAGFTVTIVTPVEEADGNTDDGNN
ncbi:MAG: sensor histidine kinase, partial [Bullifex sp.]